MQKIDRPSTLVLVRHAESLRNKIKGGTTYFADEEARSTVRGIPDHMIPLTELGHNQAKQSGPGLKSLIGVPDYVYHSGYLRTVQTTNGLLEAYTLKERKIIRVRRNPFIRERDPGYCYDMTVAEAEKHFPWLAEHWKTFGGFFARPPGGESLAEVCDRVYLFLNMLIRDRAGKTIVVVTHGGTIRCFRYLLEHWSYDQALSWPVGQSPKNCGMTIYRYGKVEKRLILQTYNQVFWE